MHLDQKTILTLVVAVAVLAPCGWFTIGRLIKGEAPIPIENFIAYNLTVLIVLGFAITIIAADKWSAACIWGGAAMFAGAAIGVLFGLPSASDENSRRVDRNAVKAARDVGHSEPPAATEQSKGQTLLGDTAGWMSKFLAGAGFAQARSIKVNLVQLSREVGSYVSGPSPIADPTALGGGILLYFGILGFFCGLILPIYYVKQLPNH